MKILISGANGFIGHALTKKLLKEGHSVFAVVTKKEEMDDLRCDNLSVFELFFDNYSKISSYVKTEIDCLVHLAWAGLSGPSAKDVNLQLSNVAATATLVEQSALLKVKKFLFISTMNTLEIRDILSCPENHSLRPVSIHVASKINAEIVARTLCESYGIQFNTAVLAMVYGENNRSKMITNVVINSLLHNQPPKLVKGDNPYDLVYVDDVVSGIEAILRKGKNKKTYYIGHNDSKTFKQFFTEIRDVIAPNVPLLFGEYPDDNAINYSLIDRNSLTVDTGWIPKADLKESILKTANWIKNFYE